MKLNKQIRAVIFQVPKRVFAPPKPAAGAKAGGGPPGLAPPAPPVEIQKTPFQTLIENGTEFIFGPPPGVNKVQNAHRDVVIPKLEGRMEVFAKKLRDFYIREGVIPDQKIYIDTLRARQPEDTIEKCVANKEIPGKVLIMVINVSFDKGERGVQGVGPGVPLECAVPD